jgi:hypothetical protein
MSNGAQARTLIVLALTLCGCGIEPAQQQQDLQVAHQSCARAGISDGTPQFAGCVEAQLALVADQRRRALEETVTPTTHPQSGSGQLCLPKAAGPSIAC